MNAILSTVGINLNVSDEQEKTPATIEQAIPSEGIDYSDCDEFSLVPWECMCQEEDSKRNKHKWHKSSSVIISVREIDKNFVMVKTAKGVSICRVTQSGKYRTIRVVRTKKSFKPVEIPTLEDEFLPPVIEENSSEEDWKEVIAELNKEVFPKGEEQPENKLIVISPEEFLLVLHESQAEPQA
jgi:hypothetical protein